MESRSIEDRTFSEAWKLQATVRTERVIYIIDELWLSFDELTYLGFRLLAVRLSRAGRAEMVVETRESPKLTVSDIDDRAFLRVCGIKVN